MLKKDHGSTHVTGEYKMIDADQQRVDVSESAAMHTMLGVLAKVFKASTSDPDFRRIMVNIMWEN